MEVVNDSVARAVEITLTRDEAVMLVLSLSLGAQSLGKQPGLQQANAMQLGTLSDLLRIALFPEEKDG